MTNARPPYNAAMHSEAPGPQILPAICHADLLAARVIVLRGLYALLFAGLLLFLLIVHRQTLATLFGLYALGDGCLVIAGLSQGGLGDRRRHLLLSEGLLGIFIGTLAATMGPHAAIDLVYVMVPWTLLRGAAWIYGQAATGCGCGHGTRAYAIGVSVLFACGMLLSPGHGRLLLTVGLGLYSALFGAAQLMLGARLRRLALA